MRLSLSKYKLPDGKSSLTVLLRQETLTNFRKFISQKYGKYKGGLLSLETELAIQSYLSEHKLDTNTYTTSVPNPLPNYQIVKEQVREYLKTRFGYTQTFQINKNHLIQAIGAVRGQDNRTMRKWMKIFENNGVLKFLGTNQVELI